MRDVFEKQFHVSKQHGGLGAGANVTPRLRGNGLALHHQVFLKAKLFVKVL